MPCAPAHITGLEGEGGKRPAVKLSDNPVKVAGDAAEIERYLRVFGTQGRSVSPVAV